jgi:hypothetical protein
MVGVPPCGVEVSNKRLLESTVRKACHCLSFSGTDAGVLVVDYRSTTCHVASVHTCCHGCVSR